MRLKHLVRCSASTLVLTAAPALAQTGLPPAAPTQAQDNQNNVAGSTPAAAQDAATADAQARSDADALNAPGNEVVVTGLRRSLQSAQNIKRNSDQIVDSVVAEDIGKLPDVAISDTAARIPGVEVERSQGEAGRVLIRGLDRENYTTTYNGREIFTAETRSVALQDFPAGGIAAVEVFKTTTADLVEGGLAGEVNVRSRRPFDFDKAQIAGSFWGQYETRSHHFNPNGNLLLTDRWTTGIGEVGALLNFSYTSLDYLDSSRTNTDFVATPTINGQAVRLPDIQRVTYNTGHRERPSLNGSLQWRPQPGLEFYVDGLWQGFRNEVSDRERSFPLYSTGPGTTYTNLQLQPGTNLVDSLTVANSATPYGFQGATFGSTNTYQFAVGGKYDSGPFKLSADLARTSSKFTNSIYSLDTVFAAPVTIDASSAGANFSLVNVDPTKPATFNYQGFFDRQQIAKGDDYQARVDATYDLGGGILRQLQAGFRYVDRYAHYEDGSRYSTAHSGTPLSAVSFLDLTVFRNGFPDDDPQGFRSYVTPTYDSIRGNITQLRDYAGFAQGTPPADPLASFSAKEQSYAGYGQIKYNFGESGPVRLDGTLGLRVVRTDLTINGTVNVSGTPAPAISERSYTDWLPNFAARARFGEQFQLRFSATKTRTRPSFSQYNPGGSVDTPIPGCTQNTTNCIRGGNSGNPNLQSVRSNNYDLSAEYYFSRTGFASATVFRRDIKGFIQTDTRFVNDPTYGLIRLNSPFNTSSGRIQGFEGQVNSFFDAAFVPQWARAFGVQANVTYLDTNLNYPGSVTDPTQPVQVSREIVGVSKWAYNIDGFFEHGGLSARLSWNWRSSFLFEPFCCGPYREDFGYSSGAPGARLFVDRARPVGRLDFSASYDVLKFLTLTADATNLLAKPLRVEETMYDAGFTNPARFPRDVRYEESVYSLGFRFRF